MVAKVKQMRDCDAITIHLLNKVLHNSDKPYPKMNQVRRNLFGFSRLNKKESQLLDKRLTDMAQKSSEEWNFDFLNEIPQTGRYVWQRVHCYDVPVWYTTANLTALNECCSQRNDGDLPESTSHSSEECFHQEKENKKSNKKPRLVQTSMKDFARVQKRRSSRRLRLKQLKKRRLQKLITSTAWEIS